MNNGKPRVGCIGAGAPGGAIIRRLINCGFAPLLWNRDRMKLADLLKAGATEARRPAELAGTSAFVITCISDAALGVR